MDSVMAKMVMSYFRTDLTGVDGAMYVLGWPLGPLHGNGYRTDIHVLNFSPADLDHFTSLSSVSIPEYPEKDPQR